MRARVAQRQSGCPVRSGSEVQVLSRAPVRWTLVALWLALAVSTASDAAAGHAWIQPASRVPSLRADLPARGPAWRRPLLLVPVAVPVLVPVAVPVPIPVPVVLAAPPPPEPLVVWPRGPAAQETICAEDPVGVVQFPGLTGGYTCRPVWR